MRRSWACGSTADRTMSQAVVWKRREGPKISVSWFMERPPHPHAIIPARQRGHEEKTMADIKFKGNPIKTAGTLPAVGAKAPDFKLTKADLSDVSLKDFAGKTLVLNIFPSIDTGVCATSVRKFNQEAANLPNAVVLGVSKDLPFAHKRFCGAEGIQNVVTGSDLREGSFAKNYGVTMTEGPLAGLMSRAVVVVDAQGVVKYTEQVPEIT